MSKFLQEKHIFEDSEAIVESQLDFFFEGIIN